MSRTNAGSPFGAESPSEVDRLAEIVVRAGARNVEGPGYHEGPGYYAVFSRIPVAIGWKSVIAPKEPDEWNDRSHFSADPARRSTIF